MEAVLHSNEEDCRAEPDIRSNEVSIRAYPSVARVSKISTSMTAGSSSTSTSSCLRWTSNIIWALGILGMAGLAVRDMYPMFRDYLDENTNLAVQVRVKRNQTINPPPLFLCMPQPQGQLEKILKAVRDYINDNSQYPASYNCEPCGPLADRGWDVWRPNYYGNSPNPVLNASKINMQYPEIQLVVAFVRKLTENLWAHPLDEVIVWQNYLWNRPIVEAMFQFLSFLSKQSGWSDVDGATDDVRKTLTRHDLDLLFDKAVEVMCYQMLFATVLPGDVMSYEAMSKSECEDKIKTSAKFIMNYDGRYFCFQLPTYSSKLDLILADAFEFFVSSSQPFYLYPEQPKSSARTAMIGLYRSQPINKAEPKFEQVTVTYSVQATVLERSRKCYDGRAIDCYVECLLTEHCDCQPFVLKTATATATNRTDNYCDPQGDTACMAHLENIENVSSPLGQKCRKQCEIICEYTFYQYIVTPAIDSTPVTPKFRLMLNPAPAPYLEFISDVKDTREDMISKVGGSLNFYLELSGFSVIIALVAVLGYCGRSCRKEKRGAIAVNSTEIQKQISPIGSDSHQEIQALQYQVAGLRHAQVVSQNDLLYIRAEMNALKHRRK